MLMDTIKILDTAGEIKKQDGTTKYVGGALYDIAGSTLSIPTASAKLMRLSVTRAFSLPASLTGSYAESVVAATASTTYTIKKNGSSIGSIDWAASGTIATFTFASTVSFAVGDILTVEAPASPDATHNELAWTFAATLV